MKKLKYGGIVLLYCLVCVLPLYAQKAFLYETLTIPSGTTTATVGTSTIQGSAMDAYGNWKALYTIEGGSVRARWDSGTTTVTSASGHKLVDGDVLSLDNLSDIRNFRVIQTGSASTQVCITYSRGVSK